MAKASAKGVYGKLGKIVSRQLPINTDLLEGIMKLCTDNGIRRGAILTTVGSLRKLSVLVPGPMQEGKTEATTKTLVVPGPLQILSLVGVIFETDKGEMTSHIHGSFIGADGKIYGGDLIDGENPALARLVTVIGEVTDVSWIEKFDEESKQRFLYVNPL
jgi:predicted DNA-binding protein with PD1-like motif